MSFVAGQVLTAAQLNAAFAACYPAGNVSSFSTSVLSQATASTWLTKLGLGSPGVANGLATLDSGGHIPTAQLPASIQGAMTYQGTWNASTNSPTLASGTGTKGFLYKVSTAGSTNLDGITQWNVGDMAVFNGTTWDKWDGISTEVLSVAGRVGVVTLTSADLTDATTTGKALIQAASAAAARTTLGLGSVATLTAGTAANNAVQLDGSAKLPAVDGSQLTNIVASTINITKRHTVLTGPTSGGLPSLTAPGTSASRSLSTSGVSSTSPLVVTAANGFGSGGAVDTVGISTANLTWSSMTASSQVYRGVTISGGVLTTFFTTLKPIYQFGGTISTTNGQYTFDVSQYKMFLGNGSVANQVNAVFVGESTVGASTVTASIDYAYQRAFYYQDTGSLPGANQAVSQTCNLGTNFGVKSRVSLLVVTSQAQMLAGMVFDSIGSANSSGSSYPAMSPWCDGYSIGFFTGSAANNWTPEGAGASGAQAPLSAANGRYILDCTTWW